MKFPKVGVGVFVIKDNKILFGRRINTHGHNTWSLPGGHLEFNEEIETCAIREVKEETGISIKNINPVTFTNDIFLDEDKHYITIFVLSEFESGDVKILELDKCDCWDWFDWNNLPSPLFLPLRNLLKQNFNPLKK